MSCDEDVHGVVLSNGDVVSGSRQEFSRLLIEKAKRAESCVVRTEILRVYCDVCNQDLDQSVSVEELMPVVGALEHREQQARFWMLVGVLLEKRMAWNDAVVAYSCGLVHEPENLDVCYFLNNNLGYCQNQLGNHTEAEAFCKTALKVNPERSNAYKNYGVSLEGQGRFVEAAHVFISGIEICPEDDRNLDRLIALVEQHPDIQRDIPSIERDIEVCRTLVLDGM
jgi:tetratricopeptide (TPR) repeat protein